MIGRTLAQRYGQSLFIREDRAVFVVKQALARHAKPLVEVRAHDAAMVACLVLQADAHEIKRCADLGFAVDKGGSGVFGLMGKDVAEVFPEFPPHHKRWLALPCGPRETKVLLLTEGGTALLSIETVQGDVTVTAVPVASA